ncbi:MAG: response regulator [candidate division Zixibacteria bacterium]|nr:response regulator [candidate division Zixibacteria bacterium]
MPSKAKILVVDDEIYICNIIQEMLSSDDYEVLTTNLPQEALRILKNQPVDLVLSDLIMGDKSGVDILKSALEISPDIIVILMTGQPAIENAISVLKMGAYDYLIKPFTLESLRATIRRGLEKQNLYRENINLKETVSLCKISEAMGSTIHLKSLLQLILETLSMEFDASLSSILLVEDKNKSLVLKAYYGMSTHPVELSFLHGEHPVPQWVVKNAKPKILNPGEEDLQSEKEKPRRSFISYPLMAKGRVIGVLNLVRVGNYSSFSPGQINSLSIIASKASSAIENSLLDENLEEAYLNILTALANAVEARDIYTRGHTERVWYMAEIIAREMGWDSEKLWEVKIGGILHDIGKIGIPDAILNKPGELTPEEFEIMKAHPAQGAKILEGISFLAPSLPYVLYHHERFDGQGYPFGLRQEKIPIQGRLLAVVDTFDAMCSDRPYRKRKGVPIALKEIEDCAGTQFDPEIAQIFLKVWEDKKIDPEKLKQDNRKTPPQIHLTPKPLRVG